MMGGVPAVSSSTGGVWTCRLSVSMWNVQEEFLRDENSPACSRGRNRSWVNNERRGVGA